MATTVYLLRHAAHGLVDSVLCGRMPGVHLGEAGQRQAAALAGHLAPIGLAALFSSPLPRAQETAAPIATRCGLTTALDDALIEIDFGPWAGRRFAELRDDPDWQRWNSHRAGSRPPGGESMAEAGERALRFLQTAAAAHPDAAIAAVSHGDVIKAVIAAVLGLSLDAHLRFEISPAGLSRLQFWPGGARLLSMNEVIPA